MFCYGSDHADVAMEPPGYRKCSYLLHTLGDLDHTLAVCVVMGTDHNDVDMMNPGYSATIIHNKL